MEPIWLREWQDLLKLVHEEFRKVFGEPLGEGISSGAISYDFLMHKSFENAYPILPERTVEDIDTFLNFMPSLTRVRYLIRTPIGVIPSQELIKDFDRLYRYFKLGHRQLWKSMGADGPHGEDEDSMSEGDKARQILWLRLEQQLKLAKEIKKRVSFVNGYTEMYNWGKDRYLDLHMLEC